jgi:hypothetical protein
VDRALERAAARADLPLNRPPRQAGQGRRHTSWGWSFVAVACSTGRTR